MQYCWDPITLPFLTNLTLIGPFHVDAPMEFSKKRLLYNSLLTTISPFLSSKKCSPSNCLQPRLVMFLIDLFATSARLLDTGLLEESIVGYLVCHNVTCFSNAPNYTSTRWMSCQRNGNLHYTLQGTKPQLTIKSPDLQLTGPQVTTITTTLWQQTTICGVHFAMLVRWS